MESITELWAPVLLDGGIFKEDYLVSNFGRVKRKQVHKDGSISYVLVTIINAKRPVVKMKGGGKEYRKSVAKLVLASFDYRDHCECANITYLDGNKKNCHLNNLRYTADKAVFTTEQLKAKIAMKAHSRVMPKKEKARPIRAYNPDRSCKTCKNSSCTLNTNNFSTDFGAEGCRHYKSEN